MIPDEPTGADQAMPNCVGEWGSKSIEGAYAKPLTIAGERVDVDSSPAFGDDEDGSTKPANGS